MKVTRWPPLLYTSSIYKWGTIYSYIPTFKAISPCHSILNVFCLGPTLYVFFDLKNPCIELFFRRSWLVKWEDPSTVERLSSFRLQCGDQLWGDLVLFTDFCKLVCTLQQFCLLEGEPPQSFDDSVRFFLAYRGKHVFARAVGT